MTEDGVVPNFSAYVASKGAIEQMIIWAGCEGISFFGLVVAMVNASLWPTIMVVAIAMGLHVLTFPVAGRLDMSGETPRQP